MPIKIADGLPVANQLVKEGVSIIKEVRAHNQDIRPLRIAILNLMPTKEATEFQLMRLLGGTPLQLEIDLLHTSSYQSKNTEEGYLKRFYKTFQEVKNSYYDGLIITGAPVEQIPFEEVTYYKELTEILKWSETNVYSRFFICWGAQVVLNYYYGIQKEQLDQKLFGVYQYQVKEKDHPFLRGFNDYYRIPESRHTTMNTEEILANEDLIVLTECERFGPDMLATVNQRDFYIFGHLEYQRETLELEYKRDKNKGLEISVPENYYPNDDPSQEPILSWQSYAYILFSNWINETYQNTPYNIEAIKHL